MMTRSKDDIDLLIVDIDDTFVYHRTVGVANALFVDAFYQTFGQKKPKKRFYRTGEAIKELMLFPFRCSDKINLDRNQTRNVRKLLSAAVWLHLLHIYRNAVNRFHGNISSEMLIRKWAKTVEQLKISGDDYKLTMKMLRNHLNDKVITNYLALKMRNPKMKTVAISQHFNIGEDAFNELICADHIFSNFFSLGEDGIINCSEIKVKDRDDKLMIANEMINKYNAKKIGVIVDDYDDVSLLGIDGLKFAMYKRRLKRYAPKNIRSIRI